MSLCLGGLSFSARDATTSRFLAGSAMKASPSRANIGMMNFAKAAFDEYFYESASTNTQST
jgi:hypothetical protein